MNGDAGRPAGWRRLLRLAVPTETSLAQAVDDELAFHVARRAEQLRERGVDPETAQREALARFGDGRRIRDECIDIDTRYTREVTHMEWLESLRSDVRQAFRTLARRPVFAATASLTLALGIGASSAMFSLVDGVLLRPLPYPQPERLVELMQSYPEKGLDRWTLSQENLAMYRDRVRDFEAVAGYTRGGATLEADGSPERLVAEIVTASFFDVLGVRPLIGRAFTAAEDRPSNSAFAVLSYGFWQSRFGGDRRLIGQTLQLGGEPTIVLGVMPPSFAFPTPDVQLYVPLGFDPTRAHPNFLTAIARLKAGATPDQARLDATSAMRDWARTSPGLLPPDVDPRRTRMGALVTPLRTAMTGNVARPLAVLQAAVVVMLLIAIANVATLLSSRAPGRDREIAVRSALGATRTRVIQLLLAESVVLAAIGGAIGIALALVIVRTFTRSNIVSLPRMSEIGVSWRVLAATCLATGISGVLFGIMPARSTTRAGIADDLRGRQSSATSGDRRMNNALIVAQISLSFVLLVSAGLLLKSFRQLLGANLGFEPARVTSLTMRLPGSRYGRDRARTLAFASSVEERVRALPGVQREALMFPAMYVNDVNSDGFLVEGHAPPAGTGSEGQTVQYAVTPGLFATLGIPLRAGRDFTSADNATSARVVIVDDALAHRYWNGAEAVGKRIRMTGDTTWLTIIGVVGSIRDESVAAEPRPHSYFPFAQQGGSRPTIVVRASGETGPLAANIRRAVNEIDNGVALDDVHPIAAAISRSLEDRRITMLLLGGFALLAVLLAGVGLYGMMALYVANRYREFGVRLAVGAKPADLLRLVLREGVLLGITGVALGAGGGVVATRWVRALLYNVSPNDPIVFSGLATLLLLIAVVACYIPARRAAGSDPLVVLRTD